MRHRIPALAGIVACWFAAPALARTFDAPIQPNYVAITSNIGGNANLVVVAYLYNASGNVALCGLYFPEKKSTALQARKSAILKNLRFKLNGKALAASAEAFAEYDSLEASKAASKGRCVTTKLTWSDSYARTEVEVEAKSSTIRE